MKKVTKEEAVEILINLISKDFGKPFSELKEDIMKTVEYGSSDHFKGKGGYSVFYTDNENYMGGIENGGGKGFFASINNVGFKQFVKLC